MGEDKNRPPDVHETPWLIFTHGNNRKKNRRKLAEKQTFCTMSSMPPNNKSYLKTVVELHGKSILASSLGWLILQERKRPAKYSIWNPVTLQSLHLPVLLGAPNKERPTCILTSPPYADNALCFVVLFFDGLVFFSRPTLGGDCMWIKQSLMHDGLSLLLTRAVATLNGDIYAYASVQLIGAGRRLLIVRLKLPTDNGSNALLLESNLLPRPENSMTFQVYPVRSEYLVEACGVLYAVQIIFRHQDKMGNDKIFKACVWRLDLFQMNWIPVESLGNRAFLLGESSTWCWADISHTDVTGALIQGDCIYFSKLGCQIVHSYRLRDDSYTSLLPYSEDLQSFDGPTWFMHHNQNRSVEEDKIENAEKIKNFDEDLNKEMNMTLSELPLDLIISIAERTHLFGYMNLRITCKEFHSALSPPKWRDGCLFPLFFSRKNNRGICELHDPYESISHTIKLPHSPSCISSIIFCKDGWLLLQVDGHSLQYFNPFTREKGEYAFHGCITINAMYAFSTSPNSSDCVTVGIVGESELLITWFQAATGKWEKGVFTDIEFKANYHSSPKYHNGAFYFIGVEGNVGVFQMIEEKWNWKVYRSPLADARESLNTCYLVELEGQLICVYIQQALTKVQMFKFEILAEKHWDELSTLGNHVLFVSPASTFSALSKDDRMSNRIYLPKFMGSEIVYYSIETGKYHTMHKQDSMDDFYGMSAKSFCCWI